MPRGHNRSTRNRAFPLFAESSYTRLILIAMMAPHLAITLLAFLIGIPFRDQTRFAEFDFVRRNNAEAATG